jgi:hypothetical protein
MATITITITVNEDDVKAVEANVGSVQEWLQKAWDGKANNCLKKVAEAFATTNPRTMTMKDRRVLTKGLTFEPVSNERQLKPLADRLQK